METTSGEVTRLLERWRAGNEDAFEEVLPLVYDHLRVLAVRYLRKERSGHTLQPTALVHEAYVRLVDQQNAQVKNRAHFFAVASQAMRRILVDHARRHHAGKRISAQNRVSLDDAPEVSTEPDPRILLVHQALERLGEINPRQAKLVELRYFGGLTNVEAAEVLGVSLATVERDWKVARLWLHRRLSQ